MKVSIAMATYNGARYLQEQLDSFVAQTRLPDELVVSDDGSTDGTLQILEDFAKEAPFPVIWEQNEENLGYARNFNKALMMATGDLVFLSDQDDVWFQAKLERLESEARVSGALVFMNDAAYTDGNLRDLGLTKLGQLRTGGLPDSTFVMGCCAAIKRDLLDLCLPVPTDFRSHDAWLVMFAVGMGRRVIVPDVLQWYRRHDANESQAIFNRTTKLTRLGVLKRALSEHLVSSKKTDLEAVSDSTELQLKVVLNGVHEAIGRADRPYRDELEKMSGELKEKYETFLKRRAIRQTPRALRLVPVVRLWATGKYKHSAGFRSVVRDLLF